MNSAARKTLALDQRERATMIYTTGSPCRSVVFFDTPHDHCLGASRDYAEADHVLMQPKQAETVRAHHGLVGLTHLATLHMATSLGGRFVFC